MPMMIYEIQIQVNLIFIRFMLPFRAWYCIFMMTIMVYDGLVGYITLHSFLLKRII